MVVSMSVDPGVCSARSAREERSFSACSSSVKTVDLLPRRSLTAVNSFHSDMFLSIDCKFHISSNYTKTCGRPIKMPTLRK